jgi:DNA-binding PadR family transcriptional regulator
MVILFLLEAGAAWLRDRGGSRRTIGRTPDVALSTLYPTLLRLADRGLVKGRWVEKPGERQRSFYRLPPQGRRALAAHRAAWKACRKAVHAVLEGSDA